MALRLKAPVVASVDGVAVPDWVLWCRDGRYVACRALGDRFAIDGLRAHKIEAQQRAHRWCSDRGLSYEMVSGWASRPTKEEAAAGITAGISGSALRRPHSIADVLEGALREHRSGVPLWR